MATVYQKFIESASSTFDRNNKTRPDTSMQLKELSPSKFITSPKPLSKVQYMRLNVESPALGKASRQRPHHSQYRKLADARDAYFKTDDPVLLNWLRTMRYETELECITSLQARTLAIDEHSAGALSVRNSQVTIQELRLESNFLLDYIDYLIELLPLDYTNIQLFAVEFSDLWKRLVSQTSAQTSSAQLTSQTTHNPNQHQNLTIINCTPRKSKAAARSLRPLDKLTNMLRSICLDIAQQLREFQEMLEEHEQHTDSPSRAHLHHVHLHHYSSNHQHQQHNQHHLSFDNGQLESSLRKLKEHYGRFVEISIRAECANIVRALNYDFSQSSLNRLSSSSSLHPVRPFESCSAQLPFKWALIALWQLTKDDTYICRVLNERWQASATSDSDTDADQLGPSSARSSVAKRLDYSTKYDEPTSQPLRSEYEKLYQICPHRRQPINDENNRGALSSALKAKTGLARAARSRLADNEKLSTIELLIEVIISQPNKHERVDMMNFIHSQAQRDKLIDVDEWDQSVSAAIYTSNQYKVAALRILNHLCAHDQAIKTILRCFSTPPANPGQPTPENKIIRSIFECYQTAQEHIYQNETMFHSMSVAHRNCARGPRKRSRQQMNFVNDEFESSENSDYGSKQTTVGAGSNPGFRSNSPSSITGVNEEDEDEGDDVVVKEAIRLLVQLTAPFHKNAQGIDYYTLIGQYSISSLVKYLTNIIKSTVSREMLFLSLTALANISFITTDPIKHYGTNGIMLEMFRTSKARSRDLELRDQAVTILANTADKNLLDIIHNGGLSFLLSCLESCPTKMVDYRQNMDRLKPNNDSALKVPFNIENKPRVRRPIDLGSETPELLGCRCDHQQAVNVVQSTSRYDLSPRIRRLDDDPNSCMSKLSMDELAALERIHQKTAVAFARMSVDPSTTRMVLKYGGLKQMIDLCKFSHKRNHSDTVLIACIAALRKMAKVIESDTFRYYNALDLIELDFSRALEIYGTQQEPGYGERMVGAGRQLFASVV